MKSYIPKNYHKHIRTLCLGLSLLTAACSGESLTDTNEGLIEAEMAQVSIQALVNTNLLEGTETRAGSDNQIPVGYRLRCKLEVYANLTNKIITSSQIFIDSSDDAFDTAIAFPPISLQGGVSYTAICWSDYVLAGSRNDLFYDTTNGLSDIKMLVPNKPAALSDTQWKAVTDGYGNNAEDAYAGKSEAFFIEKDGSIKPEEELKIQSIILKRQLTKLQLPWIKLTDSNGTPWNQELKNVHFVFSNGDLYTGFNAFTGAASTPTSVNVSFATSTISDFTTPFTMHQYLLMPTLPIHTPVTRDFYIQAQTLNNVDVTFKRYNSTTYEYSDLRIYPDKANCLLTIKSDTENPSQSQQYPVTFREYVNP